MPRNSFEFRLFRLERKIVSGLLAATLLWFSILPTSATQRKIFNQPLTTYSSLETKNLPSDLAKVTERCPPQSQDWVAQENKQSGLTLTPASWKKFHFDQVSGSALWIDKGSATCGDEVNVHASLMPQIVDGKIDNSPRLFKVLRVGWYGGSGARQIWSSDPIHLKYQKALRSSVTHKNFEASWPIATNFKIGINWKPGLYLVVITDQLGNLESIAPLILRTSESTSKLLLIHSTLTWAAYNSFGGSSTYSRDVGGKKSRLTESSFDRPYSGSGMRHIERDAISFVQYLESQGLNVDQISDVDVNSSPSILSRYSALILSGHPEYMTRNEFDSLVGARNLGINLAFFGANTAYWQVRLEPSASGNDRRMVIFRNAQEDPTTDPRQITVQFANPIINTPSSLLTGESTSGIHVTGALKLVEEPKWLKIPPNSVLSGWSPNSEVDASASGPASPAKIHLLFSGRFAVFTSKSTTSHPATKQNTKSFPAESIWFTDKSGAATFTSGIDYWACEVSTTCSEERLPFASRKVIQSITLQVLEKWQTKAVGRELS